MAEHRERESTLIKEGDQISFWNTGMRDSIALHYGRALPIRSKENDGDWYIFLQCFAHENSKIAYKNTKKNCKSFKPQKSNAASVGTSTIKPYLSICLVGLAWFARYCGKTYSCHLFSYGGMSYQVSWELGTLWIRHIPVDGEEYSEIRKIFNLHCSERVQDMNIVSFSVS